MPQIAGGLPRCPFFVWFPCLFVPQECPSCRPAGSFSASSSSSCCLPSAAYNRLVALSQRVSQAFADIDVQLKQRHDLIPNLVETVKGYASHERGTLDDVIKARNSAMSAQGPAQVGAAENQLSGALGRLIALSEAYPDLKANANFQQLAGELSDLENKIAASRRFFNNAVQEYNTGIQQLPAALFAGMFGFTRKEFFDLGASRTEVETVPTVKF